MQHLISSAEYKHADMPVFYLFLSGEFDQNTCFLHALFKCI